MCDSWFRNIFSQSVVCSVSTIEWERPLGRDNPWLVWSGASGGCHSARNGTAVDGAAATNLTSPRYSQLCKLVGTPPILTHPLTFYCTSPIPTKLIPRITEKQQPGLPWPMSEEVQSNKIDRTPTLTSTSNPASVPLSSLPTSDSKSLPVHRTPRASALAFVAQAYSGLRFKTNTSQAAPQKVFEEYSTYLVRVSDSGVTLHCDDCGGFFIIIVAVNVSLYFFVCIEIAHTPHASILKGGPDTRQTEKLNCS